MTHTSPTAPLTEAELCEIRKPEYQSDADRGFYHRERWFSKQRVMAHIAALEAELGKLKALAEESDDVAYKWKTISMADTKARLDAEAQLAARLPTEAQISYLLEVLAKEGMANDGGDFMRRKISKAILALLSGVVTPAPTAALTEEDFREVMKALEDLSFECFSPIAPCNPPSVATYNRTFEVLNKHRAARGWKVVPKSTPQGAEE